MTHLSLIAITHFPTHPHRAQARRPGTAGTGTTAQPAARTGRRTTTYHGHAALNLRPRMAAKSEKPAREPAPSCDEKEVLLPYRHQAGRTHRPQQHCNPNCHTTRRHPMRLRPLPVARIKGIRNHWKINLDYTCDCIKLFSK